MTNTPGKRPPSGNNPQGMRPRAAQPEMGLTPREILGIIRRHLILIIVCTVAGLFVGISGFVAMRIFNPQYTAKAAIRVLPPETTDPLNLARGSTNKDTYYLFRQTKASGIKQQTMLQELLLRDKVRETNWFKQFVSSDGTVDQAEAVRALMKKFGAVADRETSFIRLSMSCKSAKDAQTIVNEMMDLYLSTMRAQATADESQKLAVATKQDEALRADLRAAEASLAQIRKANPDIAEFDTASQESDVRHSVKVRRDSLEVKQADLEQQISQIKTQIQTLAKRATGSFDEVVREQTEKDPIAVQARQRILQLRPELARRIAKLGENHRSVRQIRSELKQAEKELSDRQNFIAELARQADLQNAKDAQAVLTDQLETYNKQLQAAQIEQKTLDELRANYSTYNTIREKRLDSLDELAKHIRNLRLVIDDPEISKLVSAGKAPLPLELSSPKLILYAPGGFMLGAMIGLGLAFLIELSNDTIRTPQEVMRTLKTPLLGMICHSDNDEDLRDIDPYQVIRQAPFSITSECYRQLKTNFKLSSTGTHKTIAFASGAPGEGKTTVAVNLASTLVAEGKKVLFIDANFRRPTSAKLFPKAAENGSSVEHSDYGLSNLLMGQCEVDQAIRHCMIENFDVVDSGPLPANPAELLGSTTMRLFLDRVNDIYDYVILDGPPLLISDATTIASISDAVVVIFNATSTKKGAAQRTLRELAQVNAPVIGSVLVAVRTLKGGYMHDNIETYQKYQRAELNQQIQ